MEDIHYKWAKGLEKSIDVKPDIMLPQVLIILFILLIINHFILSLNILGQS